MPARIPRDRVRVTRLDDDGNLTDVSFDAVMHAPPGDIDYDSMTGEMVLHAKITTALEEPVLRFIWPDGEPLRDPRTGNVVGWTSPSMKAPAGVTPDTYVPVADPNR